MRLYIGLLTIVFFVFFVDVVFYFLFIRRKGRKQGWQTISFFLFSVLYVGYWTILFATTPENYSFEDSNNYNLFFFGIALFILFYFTKIITIVFHTLVLLLGVFSSYVKTFSRYISMIFLAVILILIVYGILYTKYNFRVFEEEIAHEAIPESFNGYRIVQISDLHLGTARKNYRVYKRMVQQINELKPDAVVFTGDIVNNFYTELEGWEDVFKDVVTKDGSFAILGNHDYGDYVRWATPLDKKMNNEAIREFYENINWNLLRDEHVFLHRENDSLMLAGVENWGHPPFPQYGDIKRAIPDSSEVPTVLLSHDPNHWKSEVVDYPAPVFLTLSGHTHGFQFGVRRKWLNFSPAAWKFDHWGGLYQEEGKFLYVNTGAGTIAFPGRIGMRPEITLITLKNKPINPN